MVFSRSRSLFLVASLLAASGHALDQPSVKLDDAVFTGTISGNVSKFLGIHYAKPPVNDLRLRAPVPSDPYSGKSTVNTFGAACPQQAIQFPLPAGFESTVANFLINGIYQGDNPSSEDCLTVNVVVPYGTPPDAKLPVAVWIFGGGFMDGSPNSYDGGVIVQRSIDLGEPVVYVSLNYRLSAFGFLSSKEVQDAGVANLGLQDQRQALRWVQKYISAFGGDPSRVVIWGQSAGSMSTATQMLLNGGDTEGLFHGAFMQSGSPLPVANVTRGQVHYDAIVAQTNCTGSADTLACLRGVPYATFKAAADAAPGLLSSDGVIPTFLPRPDGQFLVDVPQKLVVSGQVANIPIVSGDCDDEGTVFALMAVGNITTDDELRAYLGARFLLPNISSADLDQLLALYPVDPSAGSPFDTGSANAISPQYKRVAALNGDIVFQSPRRFFLSQRADKQPVWSFLSKRQKTTPIIGAEHGSDLSGNMYAPGDMTDFLIHFVNHLDPNGANGSVTPAWPRYTPESPQLMTFVDGATPLVISEDTFRADAIALVQELSLKYLL
ncbi:carotenoid ester lipase precursor [Trametes versicolor FP-101664 SS1]|uniref:carotenoid ester lipase precursor n=1 Tax=Trametes versicolor (strain FP-101664) TaxID=717944 RepID=UPI00046212F4|nr:carotenoid ester lipase precursor [Trametes versicolor FP-101664 SS1]EIW59806.1 carotenoid ester lipase precursor [Trametes versicolor FP-101664 SS1]